MTSPKDTRSFNPNVMRLMELVEQGLANDLKLLLPAGQAISLRQQFYIARKKMVEAGMEVPEEIMATVITFTGHATEPDAVPEGKGLLRINPKVDDEIEKQLQQQGVPPPGEREPRRSDPASSRAEPEPEPEAEPEPVAEVRPSTMALSAWLQREAGVRSDFAPLGAYPDEEEPS